MASLGACLLHPKEDLSILSEDDAVRTSKSKTTLHLEEELSILSEVAASMATMFPEAPAP